MYYMDIKITDFEKFTGLEDIYEIRKELHEVYKRLSELGVTKVTIDGSYDSVN